MKKFILIVVAFVVTIMAANAKLSSNTFMKKGLVSAIKENNDKKKLSKSLNEINDIDESQGEDLEPDDIRNFYINLDDSHYQWTQSKSKSQLALMSHYGLEISNKIDNTIFASTVELPVVVESDDFIYGVVTSTPKLNDKTGLVLLFDYQDDHNFKAIIINNSQYKYMVFHDDKSNTVKTGLIKYSNKDLMNTFYIKKEGSIIHFYLNDIEYGVFKNVVITNPVFGAGVLGKTSTTILKMIFNVEIPEDTEQSTSNT